VAKIARQTGEAAGQPMSFFINTTQFDRMPSTWTVIRVRLFVLRWLFRGRFARDTSRWPAMGLPDAGRLLALLIRTRWVL
jgi:hypothetical protein